MILMTQQFFYLDSIIIKQLMVDTPEATSLTHFHPLNKIGEGSFSSVYKVKRNADSKIYALKKVKLQHLSPKDINNSLNQARILASIESPFIVQYKETFYDEGAHALCIVMEWADEGDLQKMLTQHHQKNKQLDEQKIWKAAAEILSGLELLHSKSILHRDLKTANIFISGGTFKIGDMNVSKVQTEQKQMAYTQTGTPYYASPEVWKDEPYDARSDIWSFGCIIYQMCTLHPPFQAKDIESLYKKIKKGKYEKIPDQYSEELADFINICLHQNPKQRPTAKELIGNKSSIISKKCQEYGITIRRQSIFNLLKTIKFKGGQNNVMTDLPCPRYDRSIQLKKQTEQTLEKSLSDHLSPKVSETKELSSRNKKQNKMNRLKKCKEKIVKINKIFKFSEEKNSVSSSSIRKTDEFVSLKSIAEKKNQFPVIVQRNLSERQVGAVVDFPHRYPKVSRSRNLTTQRQETVEIETEPKELDVIKQIRKRLDNQKTKVKKGGISSQNSNKVLHSHKKISFASQPREDPEIKLFGNCSKDRENDGITHRLAKLTKKGKKGSSIPYLQKAIVRVESASNKVELLKKEQGSKRIQYLKKKSKNLQK